MKFSINRNAFTQILSNVTRAIPSKATIPVLTGLKITATPKGLILIGSDAEISIESFLPVDDERLNLSIEETGSVVVTARLFNEIIRKLPTQDITVEVNDQFIVKMSSGRAVFELNGSDGETYPHIAQTESSNPIKLPTRLFKDLINQTIFSTSNQESRPILTGVHLRVDGDILVGVATDSHRLSQRRILINSEIQSVMSEPITIPKKTLLELVRIVGDEEDIEMTISKSQVVFMVDQLTIYSRLLEGNYPDTQRLIPQDHQTEVRISSTEFLQAIERASLISHQGKNNVVRLDITEDDVALVVQGASYGSGEEDIDPIAVSGNPLEISFNPDYMKDALKAFNGADIKIQFQTNVKPILLTIDDEAVEEATLLQLLTPIRTHQ